MESHLLQMRGLKHFNRAFEYFSTVASFTDAWIETPLQAYSEGKSLSHLLQMRGLKQKQMQLQQAMYGSHLLQMRGLKL